MRRSAEPDLDAVVVGASIAGCSAAIGLARRGARVALLDRRPSLDAHKTICGHFIQSSAIGSIERLGVLADLERAGARWSSLDLATPWGWIRATDEQAPALNLRRSMLDPTLRRAAAESPGVELELGVKADAVRFAAGRAGAVECVERSGKRRVLRASLIVAADGRDSRIGELTDSKARIKPNGRFSYYAYFSGIAGGPEAPGRAWFMNPESAFEFPTDGGLTMLICMPTMAHLPDFRRDLEGSFAAYLNALPDPPRFASAKRESPIFGKLEIPTVSRAAVSRGVAFVGDAALAADPLPGVGCGWAFQSAEWLAEAVGEALVERRGLRAGLRRYGRLHRRRLSGHAKLIASYSSGRPFNPLERTLYSAAVRDRRTAAHLEAFGSRRIGVGELLAPRALARAARFSAAGAPRIGDGDRAPALPHERSRPA